MSKYTFKHIKPEALTQVPACLMREEFKIEPFYLELYFGLNPQQGKPGYLDLSAQGILCLNDRSEDETLTKAQQLAVAIYQLAYACVAKQEKCHELLLPSILAFLLKPIIKKHPDDPDLLAIKAALLDLYAKQKKPLINKDNATIIIQRAYRAHAHRMKQIQSNTSPSLSPALLESMATHHIPQPPQEPTFSGITNEDKKRWVELSRPGHEEWTQRLVNYGIYYRSFAQFKHRLLQTIDQFNHYLLSLPKDKQCYVIVVPEGDVKSNHWVSALALPFLEIKPVLVCTPSTLKEAEIIYPNLTHRVYFDDALYSGRQMTQLNHFSRHSQLAPVCVIPFATHLIQNLTTSGVLCFSTERMLTPHQNPFFSKNDLDHLNEVPNHSWSQPSHKAGTFFAHKKADCASVFLNDLYTHFTNCNDIERSNKLPGTIYINKPY